MFFFFNIGLFIVNSLYISDLQPSLKESFHADSSNGNQFSAFSSVTSPPHPLPPLAVSRASLILIFLFVFPFDFIIYFSQKRPKFRENRQNAAFPANGVSSISVPADLKIEVSFSFKYLSLSVQRLFIL